jgi:hypothetical protein
MSDDAHIVDIAFRAGGMAVLTAMGEDDDGSGMLRDAIAAYAADGGATYIDETIVSLFGDNDAPLTDAQLGTLGETLVENWRA